jgi:hypothetical protein
VPLGGFANLQGMRGNQRFSIHKAYGDGGLLPSAHTCFNQVRCAAVIYCCSLYAMLFFPLVVVACRSVVPTI